MPNLNTENLSIIKNLINILTPLIMIGIAYATLQGSIKANTNAIEINRTSISKLQLDVKKSNEIIHSMDKRLVRVEENVNHIKEGVDSLNRKMEKNNG